MATWLIIALSVYAAVIVVFLIAIYTEAPKHRADIGLLHWVVALLWPFWLIWYIWAVCSDWLEKRRRARL
jgi:hypothetical protein